MKENYKIIKIYKKKDTITKGFKPFLKHMFYKLNSQIIVRFYVIPKENIKNKKKKIFFLILS